VKVLKGFASEYLTCLGFATFRCESLYFSGDICQRDTGWPDPSVSLSGQHETTLKYLILNFSSFHTLSFVSTHLYWILILNIKIGVFENLKELLSKFASWDCFATV